MKTILILDDGSTGHLRQCQAVGEEARSIYILRGIAKHEIRVTVIALQHLAGGPPTWWNRARRRLGRLLGTLCKQCVPACQRCVQRRIASVDLARMILLRPDVVISAASIGWINLWIAKQWAARSITVMCPNRKEVLNAVDLAIVPQHDAVPAGLPNVAVLEGCPHPIDQQNMACHALALQRELGPFKGLKIGLLLGGDGAAYQMRASTISALLDQLEQVLAAHHGHLFVTTSRRTPSNIERLLKDRLQASKHCRLLVIANEANRAAAVEAILGTSDVVIVSPESVSMVSEAASSSAELIVYDELEFVSPRHQTFLRNFERKGYISLVSVHGLAAHLGSATRSQHRRGELQDRRVLRNSLEAVL